MPRAGSSIVSPKAAGALGAHFPDTVTIRIATDGTTNLGAPTETFADLAGHVDLPCALAPNAPDAARGDRGREVDTGDGTWVDASHTIEMPAHRPAITEKMQAVVAGVTWSILLVEHDSMGSMTRLWVHRIT